MDKVKKIKLDTPPSLYNLEAEMGLLGCVFCGQGINENCEDVLTTVKVSDFYVEPNQVIFDVMLRLHQKGTAIDFVTITEALENENKMNECGGMVYISKLTTYTPSSAAYKSYKNIIQNLAKLRRIRSFGEYMVKQTEEPNKAAADYLIELTSIIEKMSLKDVFGELEHMGISMEAEYERILRASCGEYDEFGLKTGYPNLDKALWGLHAPDMFVLAARPGVGKTAFALNIINNVVKQKKVCAFFSLEMNKRQVAARLYGIAGKADSYSIKSGKYIDMTAVRAVKDAYNENRLFIEDMPGQTVPEMLLKAKKLKRRHGLDLIVIDYLQIIKPSRDLGNRVQEVGEIARSIKNMARQLDVPVLALCQLNRAVESQGKNGERAKRVPELSDLRESGEIEQEADIVAFLHTESKFDDEIKEVRLILGKHRNGALKYFVFNFIGKTFIFEEQAKVEEPQQVTFKKLKVSELVQINDEDCPFK